MNWCLYIRPVAFALLLFPNIITAKNRNNEDPRQYHLILSPEGYKVTVFDNSLSPNVYSGYGYGILAGYEARKQHTQGGILLKAQTAVTHYSAAARPGRNEYGFGADAWKVYYIGKCKNRPVTFSTGPCLTIDAFLHVPFSTDNNFLSYDIATSLGVTFLTDYQFLLFKRTFLLSDRLSLPLLTYLIRPAYTGPYPQAFLKNGVFTTGGMVDAPTAVKSGTFTSIGKYFNIDNQIRLVYPFVKNDNRIALTYDWDFYRSQWHDKRALYGSEAFLFSLLIHL